MEPVFHTGSEYLSRVWRQLRAGLIAAAIFFGLIAGLPLPPRDKTPAWSRDVVEPARRVQRVIMTPLAWVQPLLRISQKWSLYQNPKPERYRLQIEGLDATGWHILFRAGDSEHADEEWLIDYTRPRGAWDPSSKPPGQYIAFANWIARHFIAKGYRSVQLRYQVVHLDADGIHVLSTFTWPVVL